METSLILKWSSILWVGAVLLVGLLLNGKTLYSWIGKKFNHETDWIREKLDIMFVEVSKRQLDWGYGLYLGFIFLFCLLMLSPNLGGGAAFGIFLVWLGWKAPRKLVHIFFWKRINKFVLQMVDGLTLISNSLRSGLNVPQAMSIVQEELPNPIAQEFGLVLNQNKLGVTLEDALNNLSKRMPHDDIEMFTTSVNILKETGGNLAETFDKISYTIRERIKIESKISAMVAQGVLQGVIVVVMPFGLGAALYFIDPDKIIPMFTTVPGWLLLSVMITFQALGAWAIWKIVQVKV